MDVIPTIFNSFDFYGDNISYTFNPEDQKYYLDINTILAGIGMEGRQIDYHRGKWLLDKTISRGIKEFSEAGQPVKYCIAIDRLPYGLASLNPKSHMISRTADVVSKIEKYQDGLGDFAANVCYSESPIENEPARNTVVINQEYSPLSREEFAAFMLYEENRASSLEKMLTEFMKNQTEIITSFIEKQMEFMQKNFSNSVIINNSADSSDTIVSDKETPLVISNGEWVKSTFDTLKRITRESNEKYTAAGLLLKVYREMKMCGVDFEALKESYRDTTDQWTSLRNVDIVANSTELRALFSECLENILSEDESKIRFKGAVANKIPDIIYEKMSPLVFEGQNSRGMLLRIYHEMENHLDDPLKYYVQEFKKEHGLKNASTAYVIANSPILLHLFDEAVKSFL